MIETLSDLEKFPDYFKSLAYSGGTLIYASPWFVSRIYSKDDNMLITDIQNLQDAIKK